MKRKPVDQPERVVDPVPAEFWELRLYVTGRTTKSLTVLSKLRATCESHLPGRYSITVIDLLKQPHRARNDQILAIPTVVRALPTPMRTLIGNLSDTDNMLSGLEMNSVV
jgi:circadian clock protein KaiB